MTSVLAAIAGLTIGFVISALIGYSRASKLKTEIARWRRQCDSIQQKFDIAKIEREQVQKNVDSQLRTKDLQLKQLREENEGLKQQPS